MRYLWGIHKTYWTKAWLMNSENRKGEMVLIRKRGFWLCIQILISWIILEILMEAPEAVVLPKRFIQTGMENRTESLMLCRQKRWKKSDNVKLPPWQKVPKATKFKYRLKQVKHHSCLECGTNENRRSRPMISYAFELSVASFQIDDLG